MGLSMTVLEILMDSITGRSTIGAKVIALVVIFIVGFVVFASATAA